MMPSIQRAAAISGALILILASLPPGDASGASSRHARVKGGVGNIVVGEALPYENDAGWKKHKATGSTLKLRELKQWATFDLRAFFDGPIGSISGFEHKSSALVWFMVVQPKGGTARIFADRLFRSKAPAAYLRRDSWGTYTKAEHFNDSRRGWGGVYVQRRPPVDPTAPGSFLYEHGEILFKDGKRLNATWLEEVLAEHGSVEVTAFVKVFRFEGSGHRKAGDGSYQLDTDTSGRLEVKERYGVEEVWRFDKGRVIARGRFVIVP
jgi:hypothetical protein